MRSQLLEKQNWGEYGDMPCSGDSSPAPWSIPLDEGTTLHQSNLVRFIEVDVVPGLVQAHRALSPGDTESHELQAETVEEFAALVLAEETPVLVEYLERLHDDGASVEALYLGLLSASARRLGELWEGDIIDFTSVTIGLWRLQELLRRFSPIFQAEGSRPVNGHRALLLSTPGEQHNFGLAMLGEFLFRDGWSIAGGPGLRADEIASLVKSQFFSIVGLTLSSERGLDALKSTIALIRRWSLNRSIAIMVGGLMFIEQPELVAAVGADSTAMDAQQAAIQAERLINNLGSVR